MLMPPWPPLLPHLLQHKHIARSVSFARGDTTWQLCTGGAEKLLRIYDLQRPDAPPTGAQSDECACTWPAVLRLRCVVTCLLRCAASLSAGCVAAQRPNRPPLPAVLQRWGPRPTTSAAHTGLATTSCCWCRTLTSPTWSEWGLSLVCSLARPPAHGQTARRCIGGLCWANGLRVLQLALSLSLPAGFNPGLLPC